MEALYKFEADCGRMGSVAGVFIADKDLVAKAQGKTASLGEALGKHSEIWVDIDEDSVQMVSDDPAFVAICKEKNLNVGYNPLEYLDEDEDDDLEDELLDDGE